MMKRCIAFRSIIALASHGCRPRFLTLAVLLFWPALAPAAGVQVRFNLDNPATSPFPSDRFTVADPSHNTGLRVNLPKPDCAVRPSDCADVDVLNTLDGFNLQPRLSIPFTGPINVNTVTSKTLFLLSLGSTLQRGDGGGQVIGINQRVWDPTTNTLHVESDKLLAQHTRYVLIVTDGVRDSVGDPVEASPFIGVGDAPNVGRAKFDAPLTVYRKVLRETLTAVRHARGEKPHHIVAASVFTTQSVTALLEKIRHQLKAAMPAPADFLLGPAGTRTVFPLRNVTGIVREQQVGTDPANPASFVTDPLSPFFLPDLGFVPGAVSQLAFGKYLSPDYETAEKLIPPVGTRSGVPVVQGTNEIFFSLFLPSGPQPSDGWPVAVFGHGLTANKEFAFFVAAKMAGRGVATIAINAVGHGDGPLGTLTVNQTVGGPVTFPAGGRGIDQDGDGAIDPTEGLNAAQPITLRDGLRQTVVDLMQLVRVIEVGMDIDGDGAPDLDPSRISYFGQSLGGIYGTLFLAVEPHVRMGVLNVPGGPIVEIARLSPLFRPGLGFNLALHIPSLINVGGPSGLEFNENLPLRNQPPVINTVPGAIEIQEFIESREWVRQSGDAVAYARHLRNQPLEGVPAKRVIIQFAKGDQQVPNPTTTALLRAGNLAHRATFYRHDLAFADLTRNPTGAEVPTDPHIFLFFNPFFFPAVTDVGFGAQEQIAEFFASAGTVVIDPDGPGPLFEVPIAGPLPEELNFIP